MNDKAHEIGIIGGGIVGLATALQLAQANVSRVILVEAEKELAAHQTGNNSGVIHSGLYYKPGSLKAENCVAGREALYRFCQEQGVPHERCGKLVVATRPGELPKLDDLEQRGRANGLQGLRRLAAGEIKEFEPHVTGIAGLWVPDTGIVDYRRVCERYAALFQEKGGEIRTSFRVEGIVRRNGGWIMRAKAGEVAVRNLVNCAGLHSDRLARLCGQKPPLQIVPFRGEYYELRPESHRLVRNLIYPVPDPRFPFLGVHYTRMIGGGVEAGPNAVLAFKREGYRKTSFSPVDTARMFSFPGFWRMSLKHWRMGFGEFYRSFSKRAFVRALQRLIPEIEASDLHPGGAGVRAQALERNGFLVDDFRIIEAAGVIHVLNAPSPAATASLAIGRTIAGMARKNFKV